MATLCPIYVSLVFHGAYYGIIYRRLSTMILRYTREHTFTETHTQAGREIK